MYSRDPTLVTKKLVGLINEHFAFQGLLQVAKDDRELVLKQIRAAYDDMDASTKGNARVLEVLLQPKERGQSLIDVMKEDQIVNRNHVLYWLSQDPTPDVAVQIAELLRTCPADFLNDTEFINTQAVEHAINASSVPNSERSIKSLISLLDADFDRFEIYTEPGEWPKYVAEKLIEVTDVSFGTDKSKWQQWHDRRQQNK